jgi:hypothetical protein
VFAIAAVEDRITPRAGAVLALVGGEVAAAALFWIVLTGGRTSGFPVLAVGVAGTVVGLRALADSWEFSKAGALGWGLLASLVCAVGAIVSGFVGYFLGYSLAHSHDCAAQPSGGAVVLGLAAAHVPYLGIGLWALTRPERALTGWGFAASSWAFVLTLAVGLSGNPIVPCVV